MPSTFADRGANVSGVIPSSATNPVDSVLALNFNTNMRYLHLSDSASPPSTGASPMHCLPVPGARNGTPGVSCFDAAFFTAAPYVFMSGISWGFSTDSATYQAATAVDGRVEIVWG